MAIYKREDVLDYRVEGKDYHETCLEEDYGRFDEVVTQDDLENKLYGCDGCSEEIE